MYLAFAFGYATVSKNSISKQTPQKGGVLVEEETTTIGQLDQSHSGTIVLDCDYYHYYYYYFQRFVFTVLSRIS
jgi:hypothetical protein